jgi:tRNA A-37 threonylcarbamoyl transferase component Bud32
MVEQPGSPSGGERRLDEAIAAYYHALEAGAPPERGPFLARYPDLAEELASFLDNLAAFEGRVGGPPGPAAAQAAGRPPLSTVGPEAEALPNPEAGPRALRTFGDYELLGPIAEGGMGVVFRARQKGLNRTVALKMIRAGQLAAEADVRRFQAEAEAVAQLQHPHIVPIYEVGEHEGQHYFSMKLIEGGNLNDHLPCYRGDARSAARLVATVARAVHFAHQCGILHRDLKPANILLDEGGEPLVTDFGLAKRIAADGGLTASGAIVGTPAYMPPEQARADKLLTTAADVYALGAILYELLTGQPPFRAATMADTLLQVLEQEPTPPTELNPKADPDLCAVALKCLDKGPKRRYESAAALADELERWLRGEGVQARPVGRLRRRLHWLKQHPTITVLFGVSLVGPVFWTSVLWSTGDISTNAALRLCLMVAVSQALVLLLVLPDALSARLASEERLASRPPEPVAPPTPAPASPTVRQLQRSVLAGVARGAGEGLALGGLLLIVRFALLWLRRGRWPDPGLEWFGGFFFNAALMLGLARGLARLHREPGPLPLRLSWWLYGSIGFWFLSLSVNSLGWWLRLAVWLVFALEALCLGGLLVWPAHRSLSRSCRVGFIPGAAQHLRALVSRVWVCAG